MKDFSILKNKLDIPFENENQDLLEQAFVHSTYRYEHPESRLPNNERLEFLGDKVLDLVVAEYLYSEYPDKSEGKLTAYQSALVNNELLFKIANALGFIPLLSLGSGERQKIEDNVENGQSIIGNAFEAFIGAIYSVHGYKTCQEFIKEYLIIKELPDIIERGLDKDPKSRLQEKLNKKGINPTYKVLDESGPDHKKTFLEVSANGILMGKGEGSSKQDAEKKAAENALESSE